MKSSLKKIKMLPDQIKQSKVTIIEWYNTYTYTKAYTTRVKFP